MNVLLKFATNFASYFFAFMYSAEDLRSSAKLGRFGKKDVTGLSIKRTSS